MCDNPAGEYHDPWMEWDEGDLALRTIEAFVANRAWFEEALDKP